VDRFVGQASVFVANSGPCYRCLFPEPPEPGTVQNCADAGVLGVLPGLIGTVQATEALKLLLALGDTLVGRLLMVDALRMDFRRIAIERDPACPACGTREIRELIDYDAFCAGAEGTAAIATITPRELADELAKQNTIVLIDVREPYEWKLARIDGARLIPLGTLEGALDAIDRGADVVVYCHHGMRSEMAAYALRDAGVRRVRNLVGGIDRWSREVDPRIPRY
jgi:adenylyltransferase/sulfurtransferase